MPARLTMSRLRTSRRDPPHLSMQTLPTDSGPETLTGSIKTTRPRRPGRPTNQRRPAGAAAWIYPLLLITSTSMAGVFCHLYLNKPVIHTAALPTPQAPPTIRPPRTEEAPPAAAETTPPAETPADRDPARPSPAAPQRLAQASSSAFEETNLKIQHVLSAQGPGQQDLGRIVLDVPVVYPSGTIRWSQDDVAKARSLLTRLDAYQLKAAALRDEAVGLITEWDQLIVSSIPEPALRADSPTLPENQGEGTSGQSALDSSEVIEIEP